MSDLEYDVCLNCKEKRILNGNGYCMECTLEFKKFMANERLYGRGDVITSENISNIQFQGLQRDSIARSLWKTCYKKKFPNFLKYRKLLRENNVDECEKIDIDLFLNETYLFLELIKC